MRKNSIVRDNILKYLEFKGVTKYRFYKLTGISNGVLDKDGGVSEETIQKVLSHFREINPVWLMTGNGEMTGEYKREENVISDPEQKYGHTCAYCIEKERIISAKDKIIETQDRTIMSLDEIVKELKIRLWE